jgi:hypothetical protein
MLTGYVYVDVAGRDIGSYVTEAKRVVGQRVALPAGYSLAWSGQYEAMERVRERLKIVLPITLVLVLVLLYLNTRSFAKTAIVMLAVPFSAVGAIWLLYLLGYNMSIGVWVGLIALMGVDAETGVFMLLYLDIAYEEARRQGRLRSAGDLRDAVLHGGVKRIRPKFMTVAVMFMAWTSADERHERAFGLSGADAGPQPHEDFGFARRVRTATVRRRPPGRDRHEHVPRQVAEAGERRRQDADDRERPAVEVDLAADGRRVAAEQPRPRLVAQHGRIACSIRVDAAEAPSKGDRGTKRIEVVEGHDRRHERAPVRRHEARVLADDGAEQVRALAQFVVVAPAEALPTAVPRVPDDLVQAAGVANGEWPQDVSVEDSERDREQPEADGKRQDCGGHERGALAHPPPRVSQILQELLEPHPPAGFVEALLDDRDAAERALGGGPRGVRAHAFGDQTVCFQIQMCLDFIGEVVVRPRSGKEGHQLFAGSGPSTRAMAAARRLHRLDCVTSCARPVRVRA